MTKRKDLSGHESQVIRDSLASKFLCSPTDLDVEILGQRHWVAVPVLEGFSAERAEALAVACKLIGVHEALAVCTEPNVRPEAFWVSLDPEGIRFFDADRLLRAFLLIPEDESFLLLHEGDYFYVLAGPRWFVEKALGEKIQYARKRFEEVAGKKGNYPSGKGEWLASVAEKYAITDHWA